MTEISLEPRKRKIGRDNMTFYPLYDACMGENLDEVNKLVEAGADVNVGLISENTVDKIYTKKSPVYITIQCGYVELVKALMKSENLDITLGCETNAETEYENFKETNLEAADNFEEDGDRKVLVSLVIASMEKSGLDIPEKFKLKEEETEGEGEPKKEDKKDENIVNSQSLDTKVEKTEGDCEEKEDPGKKEEVEGDVDEK